MEKQEIKEGFLSWLDSSLEQEFPTEMAAVNFNLYDDGDDQWSSELVGTSSFDENDDDWACDEVYSNRDHLYVFDCAMEWEDVLNLICDSVKEYLENGRHADTLKGLQGVGVGFVDGDITVVCKRGC
ncbi:hypothetical protein [Clostridium sp. AM58-1XD]|uniref:hypothetical protein n=1 Tax=Clostridium sp. AM58-1XD TaxID=2292307 RepID=UPI000E486BF0|nr:hypothetical protein [Clostridium sp. AM58-1XD]RGZ00448.1 hypothetical protein DXA13_05300 [Clostridium sp. AM58-1XD]